MSEPFQEALISAKTPNLQTLADEGRALALRTAEYRLSPNCMSGEKDVIDACEAAARQYVDNIRTLISARTNQAALGT